MSQDVLEDINKKMEEMIEGRRYIIRQVGSLKVSVDELLESIKTSGISGEDKESIDFSGLTPLIEGLNEEISKLRESSSEGGSKEIEEIKSLLDEMKESSEKLTDKIDNIKLPEGTFDSEPIMNQFNEIQKSIEEKINEMKDVINELKEKTPTAMENEGLDKIIDKIEKLNENVLGILNKEEKEENSETKEVVNKLVGIVLDLKANVENIDESVNYGLKVIENNLRKELAGKSDKTEITTEKDVAKKIKESLDKDKNSMEIYDYMMDLLYYIKKENKLDHRIPGIADIIKELRSYSEEGKIEKDLKKKIEKFIS
jgi:hypothetical protein